MPIAQFRNEQKMNVNLHVECIKGTDTISNSDKQKGNTCSQQDNQDSFKSKYY